MIHRDSPESPLHDPSSTPFTRLHAAVNRSVFRANYLRRARFPDFIAPPPGPLRDGLSVSLGNYNFEFLMKFYIGSKNQRVFAGIDTSGYFIWVFCNPYKDFYKHTSTIFNPNSSTSYKKLDCDIQPCTLHPNTTCDGENKCKYNTNYLDKSFVKGTISEDAFGFNFADGKQKYLLHGMVFGCTDEARGIIRHKGIGLVGLNRAMLSLMSQLGATFGRRFSYCFPGKDDHQSRLYFGAASIVFVHGVMTTPLLTGRDDDYYLKFDAITVGEEEPIIVSPPQNKLYGNIISDVGTAITYLKSIHDITEKVKKHIPLPLKFVDHFDLCFDTSKVTKSYQLPKITFKFDGDVEFVLRENSAFSEIDDTTMCLLIASAKRSGGHQIFGYRAQIGYRVGYDIDNPMLNVRKDEDCSTKHFHAGRS